MPKRSNSENEVKTKKAREEPSVLHDLDLKGKLKGSVKCVVLKCDGSCKEVSMDSAPKKRGPENLLGGELDILGQWADRELLIIVREDQDNEKLDLNTHKLQPPFHSYTNTIRGDMLLFKLDDEAQAQPYSLSDYEAFAKEDIEEFELSEDEEDGEGEVIEASDLAGFLLTELVDKHKAANGGKEPSEEQLEALKLEADEMFQDMTGGGSDEEDDDSGDDEGSDDESDDDQDEDDSEGDDE